MAPRTQRKRLSHLCAVAAAIAAASTPAQSFNLTPGCVFGGGGQFLCSDREEQTKLAREMAGQPYLDFVQKAFVASTITYMPAPDGFPAAATVHRPGGGINLSPSDQGVTRHRIRNTAIDWFKLFCGANKGYTVRYPILDNPDLINVERLACHAAGPDGRSADSRAPLFAIEATAATGVGGDPFISMHHIANGETVRKLWGYPRMFQRGDNTNEGMVLEVKVPLARVQSERDGKANERWVKLVELEPLK